MSNPIQNRYDFMYFFDITDGNPNGDPDAGNLPRIDPETGQGLVTDVCLKRKVRNYIAETKDDAPGYQIYVKEKAVLNQHITVPTSTPGSSPIRRSCRKRRPMRRRSPAGCAPISSTFGPSVP